MPDKKNIISRALGFFVVVLIFYFLGKNLFLNWEEVKAYPFSFNYFYLLASFAFLIIGFLVRGFTWKKIVNFLEPVNDLGWLEAIKIDAYSQLGRYLPGKVFAVVGKIYLARNKKISKANLYLSALFDALFHPMASFLLSLVLISFFFDFSYQGIDFLNFYLIGCLVVVGGLLITHPQFFKSLIKLLPAKIIQRIKPGGEEVDLDFDLGWFNRIKIILYYALADFFMGLGFFYLICSVTSFSIQNVLSMIGIYILAGVLGFVALFVPSGLGVREGVLVLFLQSFFPLNIAILISFLARIWASLADVVLAGTFYLLDKIRKSY